MKALTEIQLNIIARGLFDCSTCTMDVITYNDYNECSLSLTDEMTTPSFGLDVFDDWPMQPLL